MRSAKELSIDPKDLEDLSLWKRFVSKVNFRGPNGCWEWTGNRHPRGYGMIKHRGRTLRAHRFSYAIFHGPIPAGRVVCHRCDNPRCVRYDHLFEGSAADNIHDMIGKGRDNFGHFGPTQGSANGRAQLNEHQVLEIKDRLRHPYPGLGSALSREYGVTRYVISSIRRGKTWPSVGSPVEYAPPRRLSEDQVREIKKRLNTHPVERASRIAQDFNISESWISEIRSGRAWKYIKIDD